MITFEENNNLIEFEKLSVKATFLYQNTHYMKVKVEYEDEDEETSTAINAINLLTGIGMSIGLPHSCFSGKSLVCPTNLIARISDE